MGTKSIANIALLVVATSLCVLACETPVPDSFEGTTDAPPKAGKSSKKDSTTSKLDTDADDDDDATSTPSTQSTTPATPAKPAEAPVADCKGRVSFEDCVSCCDPTNVYPAFLSTINACAKEATCEKSARDGCFANAACAAADKCLLPNGCWEKKTAAEIANPDL